MLQWGREFIALATSDVGKGASAAHKWFFETRYWLRDLVLSVLLAFIVIVFLYQPVQVEGTSMMPRLENHERIFINKFVYRFEPIKRGDVVVFWYPLDTSKSANRWLSPMSRPAISTARAIRLYALSRATILCWVTTGVRRTTAGCGAPSSKGIYTAKRPSCTGPLAKWDS